MADGAINVILGGALAILGGAISHLFSRGLLEKQLRHESEERAKGREYQTKKEIYIDLIEKYALLISELGNLQNHKFTPTLVSETTAPFSAAISKAQLIANTETLSALDKVSIEIQKIVQKTVAKLMFVWETQFELENNVALYEKYSDQQDQILQEMGKLNLNPHAEMKYRMDYLSERFDQNKNITQPLMQERTELISKLANKKMDYTRSICKDIFEIETISVSAFQALRQELGYQTSDAYNLARRANVEEAKKSLQQFIDDIERKIQKENEGSD